MNDSLINIDPELLSNSVNNAFKTMHKSAKHFKSVRSLALDTYIMHGQWSLSTRDKLGNGPLVP